MNEIWFDPSLYAWIPGTVYGTTLGIFGGISGGLASTGKAKSFILGVWIFYLLVAILFLGISLFAFLSGQPYGIWYGFGLPGLLGIILCPILLRTVKQNYRIAEERRMQAADL
ncbi:Hypothetical protein PBC10988_33070 [Planctomycetales bacterium 10988]|nr:Hypothetical protein PBC10988_33070 [Planctomycetales bacterium 10988]